MAAPSIEAPTRQPGPKGIPALTRDSDKIDPIVRAPLDAMRSAVQTMLGFQGDPLDKAITLRDAQRLGFITTTGLYQGGTGSGSPGPVGPPGPPGTGTTPDLTPPPDVTGLTGAAGLANVIFTWDAPTYTVGHGHQATNLYAVKKLASDPTLPTFADAVLYEAETSGLTIAAIPSDLAIRWHVWAKFLTNDGVESPDPAGGLHGVTAQTGKIGNSDLGPLIIEAGNLADGTVTASKIAAQAVTQAALALGSVSADKLVITGHGAALNQDPGCLDLTAWNAAPSYGGVPALGVSVVPLVDGIAGSSAIQLDATGTFGVTFSREFQVTAGKQYKLSLWARRKSGSGAGSYFRVLMANGASTVPDGTFFGVTAIFPLLGTFENVDVSSSSWVKYTGTITAPVGAVKAVIDLIVGYPSGTGVVQFQDVRCEEYIGGDLIVDGAIVATKLAANAIAVGSLAVQNGAIVNAMIGTAAIDDAKVANLSAAKLTVGDGTVGGNLKSTTFISGSAGWILRPNGSAEFDFAHVRGTLLAGQVAANYITAGMIDSRGLSIRDGLGNVILAAGSPLDFSNVGGTTKPSDNAGAVLVLIGSSGISVQGNSLVKTTGTGWGQGAYSRDTFTGGAYCSFVPSQSNLNLMVGLNTDPTTDQGYVSIDYAIYARADGQLEAYASGISLSAVIGSYAAGDVLAVQYDGSFVRWSRNGVVLLERSAPANLRLSLDSSFYEDGCRVTAIQFGPYGNPSAISPNNPITLGNASTYIANAAITTALIGDASIVNAKIGDTIQSPGFVAGSTGWRIQKSTDSAEFQNLTARGNITATHLNAADGMFAGTLSAAAIQLAGNALFIPNYAYYGGVLSTGSGGTGLSYAQILSSGVVTPGPTGTVMVIVTFGWQGQTASSGDSGDGGGNIGSNAVPIFEIRRGSSTVLTEFAPLSGAGAGNMAWVLADTPGGSISYTLWWKTNGAIVSVRNMSMLVLGVTR